MAIVMKTKGKRAKRGEGEAEGGYNMLLMWLPSVWRFFAKNAWLVRLKALLHHFITAHVTSRLFACAMW